MVKYFMELNPNEIPRALGIKTTQKHHRPVAITTSLRSYFQYRHSSRHLTTMSHKAQFLSNLTIKHDSRSQQCLVSPVFHLKKCLNDMTAFFLLCILNRFNNKGVTDFFKDLVIPGYCFFSGSLQQWSLRKCLPSLTNLPTIPYMGSI